MGDWHRFSAQVPQQVAGQASKSKRAATTDSVMGLEIDPIGGGVRSTPLHPLLKGSVSFLVAQGYFCSDDSRWFLACESDRANASLYLLDFVK